MTAVAMLALAAEEAATNGAETHETFLGIGAEGWVALSFFAFVAVLVRLGVHRFIAQALDRRAEKIRAELEEARNLKQEAQAALAELQRSRRKAESDAEAIIAQAEEDARLLLADAAERIERMSERRRAAAEQKIAQAQQQAINAVRAEAARLAAAAARRLLGEELRGEKGERLIGETIEEIGRRLQ